MTITTGCERCEHGIETEERHLSGWVYVSICRSCYNDWLRWSLKSDQYWELDDANEWMIHLKQKDQADRQALVEANADIRRCLLVMNRLARRWLAGNGRDV